MAGWGVGLIGLEATIRGLQAVQTRLEDDGVYVVGTNVEYAIYVELGTSRMEAQPFLFAAARAAERDPEGYLRSYTNVTLDQIQSTEQLVASLALAIEADAKRRVPVDSGNLRGSIRTERVR